MRDGEDAGVAEAAGGGAERYSSAARRRLTALACATAAFCAALLLAVDSTARALPAIAASGALGFAVARAMAARRGHGAAANPFDLVFDRSAIAMAWMRRDTGTLLRANPAFEAFTGYAGRELENLKLADCAGDGRPSPTVIAADRPPTENADASREIRFRRRDGSEAWALRLTIAPPEAGASGEALIVLHDVTERKKARELFEYLANHDPLTGLTSRAAAEARLASLLRGERRNPVGVLAIDLDRFKDVNDAYGHAHGDDLLVQVAERLRSCVAREDIISRFGGDEFIVVCDGFTDVDHIRVFAERLARHLSRPYTVDSLVVAVGASVGVAVSRGAHDTAHDLLKQADIALYMAKGDGRGRCRFFESSMQDRIVARQALKADLAQAIRKREFELVFQPIVAIDSNDARAFEALARWRHPERGLVAPGEFIPMAEELGLIASIGMIVLEQACRAAVRWPDDISVSVNVSPPQIRDPSFALNVASVLGHSGLRPSRLTLEITEAALLDDSGQGLATLRHLRELGARIALDDFGAGHSSLTHLQTFRFDAIKIDRAFMAKVVDSRETQAIFRAVTDLGDALSLAIVAEGIETEEQLAEAKAAGCQFGQGYFFSRPMAEPEIAGYLARKAPPGETNREALRA